MHSLDIELLGPLAGRKASSGANEVKLTSCLTKVDFCGNDSRDVNDGDITYLLQMVGSIPQILPGSEQLSPNIAFAAGR